MKITKYAQSCFLIETKGRRILIDPGNLKWENSFLTEHWTNISVILVTHKHGDHCDDNSIKEIMKNPETKFYTSQEVAKAHPELIPEIVKAGEVINLNGIKVEVVKAVHGYIPWLKGGNEILENLGYIVDDGDKRIYFTSDTICFENNYKCDVVCVPVSGHGLVMGPFEAALFAKEVGAKLIIPTHCDNPKFPVDPNLVKKEFEKQGVKFKFLGLKEGFEI